MENEFYTNKEIQLLMGVSLEESNKLICRLNNELIEKYKEYHLDIPVYDDKILKEYFVKRMES